MASCIKILQDANASILQDARAFVLVDCASMRLEKTLNSSLPKRQHLANLLARGIAK